MMSLKDPEEYLPLLLKIRKEKPYAKDWNIYISKCTNRHTDCCGHAWGWYQIEPFKIEVGHWSQDMDDLSCVNIVEWNIKAINLSKGVKK